MPCYGTDPGYSLDLMRRRPDSANGLTEYLIANAALSLGASGVERLSLNFAAWGRLLDESEDMGVGGRIQRRVAKALNPFFQIQSLRDFNEKFDPEWLPRSIVDRGPGRPAQGRDPLRVDRGLRRGAARRALPRAAGPPGRERRRDRERPVLPVRHRTA